GQTVFVQAVVEERGQGDRSQLRQMRGQPYSVVVLLRANPQRARADFLQNFNECGNTRLAGGGMGDGVASGDQCVGMVAKQFRVGSCDSAKFPAGHRMSAKKNGATGALLKV